jgi:hypothetical protein
VCQYGQGVVRRVFQEFDVDNLKGFAVWLPMMRNDSAERARVEAAPFEGLSVAHAWDPDRQLGHMFTKLLGLESTVSAVGNRTIEVVVTATVVVGAALVRDVDGSTPTVVVVSVPVSAHAPTKTANPTKTTSRVLIRISFTDQHRYIKEAKVLPCPHILTYALAGHGLARVAYCDRWCAHL